MPVPKNKLEKYKEVAAEVGKISMKHGALAYRECVLEDPKAEHGVAFTKLLETSPQEAVVMAFVIYKSKKHREKVNAKVMKDKRMQEICEDKSFPFNPKRMTYGGFETIVNL